MQTIEKKGADNSSYVVGTRSGKKKVILFTMSPMLGVTKVNGKK